MHGPSLPKANVEALRKHLSLFSSHRFDVDGPFETLEAGGRGRKGLGVTSIVAIAPTVSAIEVPNLTTALYCHRVKDLSQYRNPEFYLWILNLRAEVIGHRGTTGSTHYLPLED